MQKQSTKCAKVIVVLRSKERKNIKMCQSIAEINRISDRPVSGKFQRFSRGCAKHKLEP
jgi:hypothetical protein